MKQLPSVFWAVLILAACYVFFAHAVGPLTGFLTGTRAPLPSSLVQMYTAMVAIGTLLYLSVREERWQAFVGPVVEFLGEASPHSKPRRVARRAVLVAVPLVASGWAFLGATADPEAPADPPGIHFNLPNEYVALVNPLLWTDENIRQGGILFTKNCAMCHGDAQDGNGLFARAFQPRPANFRDTGTIAQLDENYLYWRIKTGGPGLPQGSIEYRSSMPVWENVLTDEEIWKVIMFEYTNAGVKPAKRE